jgi:hypothetical protein
MKLRHYKLRMPSRAPSRSRFEQERKARAGQPIRKGSAADLLAADPAVADINFEPPRADIRLRPADLP